MSTRYFCANCKEEFVTDEPEAKPRCPKCMRRSGIEAVRVVTPSRKGVRGWLVGAALVLAAAGIGYGAYRASTVALDENPPLRPLEPRELSAYLQRDQIAAGPYASMFALPTEAEGWPSNPAELSGHYQLDGLSRPLQTAA